MAFAVSRYVAPKQEYLMRFASLSILAAAVLLAASPAHAQRAVQASPDGANLLISKPLAGQQWSIVVNFDAQTVAGNVFNFDGSNPQFIYCTIVDPFVAGPAGFSGIDTVTLECKAAGGCTGFPCTPAEWTDLGSVEVIGSFFLPTIAAVQGATPTSAATPAPIATTTPQPTFTTAADPCCTHCANSLPCGDSCIPFTFICRQQPGCACF